MTGQDEPKMDKPRRFYKEVSVVSVEGGYAPLLDGRSPKSPRGERLVLPTEALADLVAGEWESQGEHIEIATMPATRLAYTVLDQSRDKAAALAEEFARYAGSDLTCYLADHPAELRAEEEAAWAPWRDWAARERGVALVAVSGLTHKPQSEASLLAAARHVLASDPFVQAGLLFAAPLFGSAVLALALEAGALSGDEAFRLSRIDEEFQARRWGRDEEAEMRAAALMSEAMMIDLWFEALRG